MTVVIRNIYVTQDVPDSFYTYMKVDFAYTVKLTPTNIESTAVITCLNNVGWEVEIYRKVFSDVGVIEDVGAIVESYVMQGIYEFTITVTSADLKTTRTFRAEYMEPKLILKKEIHDLVFSSALENLTFSVIGTRADYSLKFKLRCGNEILLSESYVPDANNEIVIRELSSLIEPYVQGKLVSQFEIEADANDFGKLVSSFTVIYCKAEVDMFAEDFASRFFLSTLMGAKVTALGQKEYLHFVTTDEDFASGVENNIVYKIYADYVNSEMKQVSNIYERNIQLNANSLQIVTIDVSPFNFIQKGLMLVAYKVTVGSRIQTYCVNKRYDSEPDIAFKNSFGLLETLYFTGTKEDAPEISRSAGYVNGEYRNYHIEENRVVKAKTGVIPEAMVCLVDELARSTEAYLIEKGEIGRQITITDSELKRTNDLDSLYSFQITYRLAKRNQNVLKVVLPAKTFDSTFDKTFE